MSQAIVVVPFAVAALTDVMSDRPDVAGESNLVVATEDGRVLVLEKTGADVVIDRSVGVAPAFIGSAGSLSTGPVVVFVSRNGRAHVLTGPKLENSLKIPLPAPAVGLVVLRSVPRRQCVCHAPQTAPCSGRWRTSTLRRACCLRGGDRGAGLCDAGGVGLDMHGSPYPTAGTASSWLAWTSLYRVTPSRAPSATAFTRGRPSWPSRESPSCPAVGWCGTWQRLALPRRAPIRPSASTARRTSSGKASGRAATVAGTCEHLLLSVL